MVNACSSKLRLRGGGCGTSKPTSDQDTGEVPAARGQPVQAKEQALELISPKSETMRVRSPRLQPLLYSTVTSLYTCVPSQLFLVVHTEHTPH
jgi:hypothetical protein